MIDMTDTSERLAEGCAGLDLELAAEDQHRVINYLILLQKWNRAINLTGTRNEAELMSQHVVDCLAVVRHLGVGCARLIDVGSGAGLPGAVVAMVRPDMHVTALEPNRKKQAFLAAVKREVGVPNLEPCMQRLEEHVADAAFRPYDVAVSRATFAVPEWLQRAQDLVRPGGTILAMEGAEQHTLPAGARRHPYNLGNRSRAIIELHIPE